VTTIRCAKRTAQPPREAPVVRGIVERLKKEPQCMVRKRHGTAFCYAGDADLYGCFRGRHFEIEVKRPGKEPTDLQRARLEDWRAAGALAGWATSVAEALAVLGIDK
jgi:hypothetical protein